MDGNFEADFVHLKNLHAALMSVWHDLNTVYYEQQFSTNIEKLLRYYIVVADDLEAFLRDVESGDA